MFRPAGLFKSNQCPDQHCSRNPCLFSHTPVQSVVAPAQSSQVSSDKSGSSSLRQPARPTVPPNTVAKGSTVVGVNINIPKTSRPPAPPQATTSTSARIAPSTTARTATSRSAAPAHASSVTKRPVETPTHASSSSPPPAKVPKIAPGPVRKAAPPSVASLSPSGAPILNINAANTNVPLKDRQRMATVVFETFRTLYSNIPQGHHTATLAGQHAIAQEAEIYARSQRTTYKNNGAHTITLIKKRPKPNHINHPSVGTQGTIDARKAEAEQAKNAIIKRGQLEAARLTREQLTKWGYLVTVPDGPGGSRVSDEGKETTCERCQTLFVVHAPQTPEEREELSQKCTYHWGRTYLNKVGGIREMVYKCCGSPAGAPGCVVGAHVFKDTDDPDLLHARHPYTRSSAFAVRAGRSPSPRLSGGSPSPSPPPPSSSPQPAVLDIAALDCEMIYTTAGMSIARVSVIDVSGKCVYDKLIKLDPGVEVLDYNTRFSGITSLDDAKLDLYGVRRELRKIIGPETILIGHALENDMRALRMVHMNVVDTTVLFPHPSGFPYRRALKDLAREHLGLMIQNGGETLGHSSLEDAIATLDLVKFWVQERKRRSPPRSPRSFS